MKLYYFPAACSLAANICLREAAVAFDPVRVDLRTGRIEDGRDFTQVNSKGYVPALQLDDGQVLTENVAVLCYIAGLNPAAKLAPPAGSLQWYRMLEWLAFTSSEVHKSFSPLFAPTTPEAVKQFMHARIATRLGWLAGVIGPSYLLGEQFTVADAYLFTILGWGGHVGVDIGQWPALKSFHERVRARPATLAALTAEGLLKG
jgi:glutathione S-transferase